MSSTAIYIAIATAIASAVITGLVRTWVIRRGLLDVPNERSSHSVPTPRGGGIAIVLATIAALGSLAATGEVPLDVFVALGGGGVLVAFVGYLDDRRSLSARVRLSVHFAAALWTLSWLGGLPPLQFGEHVFEMHVFGYVLGALGIVWTLNLFNFMDGIDGIAASEAIFVSVAGAVIHLAFMEVTGPVPAISAAFAAAACGFLVWNWPPAKIFMGDVGSGFMGYMIAALAIIAARHSPVALLVWVILGGLFFIDATVTLVRRLLRREPLHEAHRSHAYQWLSRRWASHLRVTSLTLLVDVVWLLPCAFFAAAKPDLAGWIVLIALLPIVIGAWAAGAGCSEVHHGQ